VTAAGIRLITFVCERLALQDDTMGHWWKGIARLPIVRHRPRAPPSWPIDAGMSIEPLPMENRK
jgi:hypothetical protein